MTREQWKRRRKAIIRTVAAILTGIALWALGIALTISANAALDAEGMKTDLAVTGAFVWAWLIMRVVLWLDAPRGKR